MKTKRIYLTIVIASAFILSNCGFFNPSASEARVIFEKQHEAKIKDGSLKVLSFSKTDGQSAELLGVKLYSLKYEAELQYPNGRPGTYFEKGLEAGGTDIVKGEINFEKTENGWQPRK